MAKTIHAPGEEIVVNFFNLPGSIQNWLGPFDAGLGTNPDDHTECLDYEYTSDANGSVSFSGRTTGKPRRGKGKPTDTRFCCGNGVKEAPEGPPPDFLICDGNF